MTGDWIYIKWRNRGGWRSSDDNNKTVAFLLLEWMMMMVVVESQDFNASTDSSSSGWTRIILPRTTHGNYFNIFYFSRNTLSSCMFIYP